MKYINANMILPEKLIEEIQKYIQGKYIYIPIKKENYKSWGAISGIKQEYKNRNKKIKNDYKQGISIENLAQKFYIQNRNRRFSLINKLSLLFLVRLILYYSWCRINNFTSILWIYESYLNILI